MHQGLPVVSYLIADTTEKSLTSHPPSRHLHALVRSPLCYLFWRLNWPNSPSLYLKERFSSPFIIFVTHVALWHLHTRLRCTQKKRLGRWNYVASTKVEVVCLVELVTKRVKQVKILLVIILLLFRLFYNIFQLGLLNAIQSSKFFYVFILFVKEKNT